MNKMEQIHMNEIRELSIQAYVSHGMAQEYFYINVDMYTYIFVIPIGIP